MIQISVRSIKRKLAIRRLVTVTSRQGLALCRLLLLVPLGFIHGRITKPIHGRLLKRSGWYASWWHWPYHKHIHIAGSILAVLTIVTVVSLQLHGVLALSTWIQSDWSGGVGSSTTNQYSSGSNVNTSTANQVTQSVSPNLIPNPGFETNLSGWQGGLSPSSIAGLESGTKPVPLPGLPTALMFPLGPIAAAAGIT